MLGLQVKNTFLELAEDDGNAWLTSLSLKRQQSDPPVRRRALSESMTQKSRQCIDDVHGDVSDEDFKATSGSFPLEFHRSSSNEGGSTYDGGSGICEEKSSSKEECSTVISSEDDDSCQWDMHGCQEAWTSSKGTCRQLTEQMWPTPNMVQHTAGVPQVTWVPMMMPPQMFQSHGHYRPHDHRRHHQHAPNRRAGGKFNGLPKRGQPGGRRKEYSLITLAKQEQEILRQQQQPVLNQMQLKQLREQLQNRVAELTLVQQQSDEGEHTHREQGDEAPHCGRIAFCPFCGGQFKAEFKFCGYCGEEVSSYIGASKD
jgi:hypothetical protein